jgi:hypothetical protein
VDSSTAELKYSNEPDAHAIADMRTAEDKATIEGFATVADAFNFNGDILG